MVYLIAEQLQQFYKCKRFWSTTMCFTGLLYLFILVVPFFLAFVVDDFWLGHKVSFEEPQINFQGDHLLQCFSNNQEYISTSIEMLDKMIGTSLDQKNLIFMFKVTRVDNNSDGLYEFFNIFTQIQFTNVADTTTKAMECSIYFFTTVSLRDKVSIQMQAPLHIRLSRSNTNNQKIHIVGDIQFVQKNPLQASQIIRNNYNYTVPILPPNQDYMGLTDFLKDIQNRNETLRANYIQTYGPSDTNTDTTDLPNQLTANIFLKVPVLTPILYVPTLRENLKLVFQYYVFLFIPIYWLISIIISFSLKNNIFKNTISNNLPLKEQNELK
ncbi:transmembrane protein, putative (macronuclear) [Tetrahymena thermophila SB210]|uniref:Transmembrane protein 231 n=1 Tax=Tetrahymena thermophila (strain SB210) TaxID=312017 RepID=Q238R6_TETTS|nr:transmembrane protein, putative [Tetrahymena thermophila SB210]EAR93154.3 transmembrane protein, putative [Tetrahymena thermophila SB210]|eukprot:XP_001013399.3 transmembrane protein, putative [Tetrahymena thermophila SB210]